ncbi:asparagine synthase (glutamine-hydrolysing) [Candidatus Magnetomoraceae bacterium gMMP-1]
MCGIAGFCDFTKKSTRKILFKMTDILFHRGPDDSGCEFFETSEAQIGLGHRRLSILDISKLGSQPMSTEDGNYHIVYNGEVYNFIEIRKDLEKEGFRFNSNSDTEVILNAYIRWGIDAVHKFIGMFVFLIYDRIKNKIIIFRDRTGIKPLFYYFKNGQFFFASELKSFHEHPAFHKELDINSLALYLQHGYIPCPHCIFKYCYKLRPGHYLEIKLKTQDIEEKKYWDIIDYYNKPKLNISNIEAIDEVDRILKSAFEYRMVSDVPVGVFLSGGYDSSVVAALLQKDKSEKIKTFTIGFHEQLFNEAHHAKKVAEYLGTDHTEYYCTQKEALDIIPELPVIYDEPFGDSSAIPTILVSKLARQQVTVALSADGGDETFAGYDKYLTALKYFDSFIPKALNPFICHSMGILNPNRIPLLRKKYNFSTRYKKVRKILLAQHIVEAMNYTSQKFIEEDIDNILMSPFALPKTAFDENFLINSCNDNLSRMLAIDYKSYLTDDIMVKVDRATMSLSLEGREPLLDHRIIEFVSQLPSSMKYKNNQKKILLKSIAHKYLPEKIMNRPKMGFRVPVEKWFREELKGYFLHYLSKTRLENQEIFNVFEVLKLRNSYFAGNRENVQKLWLLLMFEMWYDKYYETEFL